MAIMRRRLRQGRQGTCLAQTDAGSFCSGGGKTWFLMSAELSADAVARQRVATARGDWPSVDQAVPWSFRVVWEWPALVAVVGSPACDDTLGCAQPNCRSFASEVGARPSDSSHTPDVVIPRLPLSFTLVHPLLPI